MDLKSGWKKVVSFVQDHVDGLVMKTEKNGNEEVADESQACEKRRIEDWSTPEEL